MDKMTVIIFIILGTAFCICFGMIMIDTFSNPELTQTQTLLRNKQYILTMLMSASILVGLLAIKDEL